MKKTFSMRKLLFGLFLILLSLFVYACSFVDSGNNTSALCDSSAIVTSTDLPANSGTDSSFLSGIKEVLKDYYVEDYDAYYLFMCLGLSDSVSLKIGNTVAFSDENGRIIVFEPRLDYGYYGIRRSAVTVLVPFNDEYRIDMSFGYYFLNGNITLYTKS